MRIRQVRMLNQICETFAITIKIGTVEFALQELGNSFMLIDLAQPHNSFGTLQCGIGCARFRPAVSDEWDRNRCQQQQHRHQLHQDDFLQRAVEHVNAEHNRAAEAQLQPAHVPDFAGDLVTHQHDSQRINAGSRGVQHQ